MKTKFIFKIENLSCAHCAQKIESTLQDETNIKKVTLNFLLGQLNIETIEPVEEEVLRNKIENIATQMEKSIQIVCPITKGRDGKERGCCSKPYRSAEDENTYDQGQLKKDKIKRNLKGIQVLISGLLLVVGGITHHPFFYFMACICLGYKMMKQAAKSIFKGKVLDEQCLMTLATLAALGIGEYIEAVAIIVFYQIGEYLKGKAVSYSQKEIKKAIDIRPTFARVVMADKLIVKRPETVKVGEILQLRVGEKLALDGKIIEGTTLLDTSLLTGESLPKPAKVGDQILSGVINRQGVIKVQVTTKFEESTVSQLVSLIEEATSKKAKAEDLITQFAKWYTPLVVLLAIGIGLIPSLVMGNWHKWLYISITFLVISCPCAIVISVPLSYFAGLGAAAHHGILIKGSQYLEQLNHIKIVVLDKTGTLTKGKFGISKIIKQQGSQKEILQIAGAIEKVSNHPIAQAIMEACSKLEEPPSKSQIIQEVKEISGEGMTAIIDGERVIVGNYKLTQRYGIKVPKRLERDTCVYVTQGKRVLGYIVVSDQIKEESRAAITSLRTMGIEKIVMLTGDQKDIALQVGEAVGVDQVYANLLPQDKVRIVEDLLKEGKTAFIGDGINDAPVLGRADVGIAMGEIGADIAIETADIVFMTDRLTAMEEVIKVAQQTRRIVIQNMTMALGIKGIVMVLGIFGLANMWLAIFADMGISLLAILNAIRPLIGQGNYLEKIIKA